MKALCSDHVPQIQLSSKTRVKYCQIHKTQLIGKGMRAMKDNKVLEWN